MFDVTEVVAAALSATRLRVNTLASNIANAETTRTPEGGPYKRRDVVQTAISMPSKFDNVLDRMSLAKPSTLAVVEDTTAPKRVFQPGHPDADKEGFVSFPNINVVTTMTDLMSASRLYQANTTVLDTTRRMSQDAQAISVKY